MTSIVLPTDEGRLVEYAVRGTPFRTPTSRMAFKNRMAYAAAHVVTNPLANADPSFECSIDMEATLAYRRHLWSLGFGVAEAMDTAQRGMGLPWSAAKDLIVHSVAEAKTLHARIACGVGTDHLDGGREYSLSDIEHAYEEQCEFVEAKGGRLILMASRALAATARSSEDYTRVYHRVLSQVSGPVILHWLGDMFDPQLRGYFGHDDSESAMDVCLNIISQNQSKVEGIKISLLDAEREIQMRQKLPRGVRMYTGDDFNFPELILGDRLGHSDALLGIFDAIAPVAAAALQALDDKNTARYSELLRPTVALSRHIFAAPTQFYKTGVVFLAYLNGHQSHFKMVRGLESMRSVPHLANVFRLADEAGLLSDPERAISRMRTWLATAGVV